MAEKKEKDILVQALAEKYKGTKTQKLAGKSLPIITVWALAILTIFFITPLVIGMWAAGFVDLTNNLALVIAIIYTILLIGVGGFL